MNLTKIANKLWEVVGLAFAFLFLAGILAIFAGVGYSIYQFRTRHVEGITVEPREDKGKLKLTVEYGLPLPLEDSDFLMIPVKLEKKKLGEEREAVNREIARRDYSYDSKMASGIYSFDWGPYYNLVFINKKTGESRPLLADKGFIDGIYFPEKKYDEEEPERKPTFLLLKIAMTDTNRDGVINEKDASAGYLAKMDGTRLTQITPENTQMRGWYYDADWQTIFVEIVRDANQDGKFNWDDPETIVSTNVLDPEIGQEIIPAEIKDKVESILLKK
jgi:hypothetical protein